MIPADGWRESAACAGATVDLWFPEKGDPLEPGIAVCRACPVRAACLEHALAAGEDVGIWGGMSAAARRKLRKARREDLAA